MMPLPNPLSRSTIVQMCQTFQSEYAAVGRTEWGLMFTTKSLQKAALIYIEMVQLESSD